MSFPRARWYFVISSRLAKAESSARPSSAMVSSCISTPAVVILSTNIKKTRERTSITEVVSVFNSRNVELYPYLHRVGRVYKLQQLLLQSLLCLHDILHEKRQLRRHAGQGNTSLHGMTRLPSVDAASCSVSVDRCKKKYEKANRKEPGLPSFRFFCLGGASDASFSVCTPKKPAAIGGS